MPAGPVEAQAPPAWARPFVWSLLLVLLVCGISGLEAWPLSGFRLFSQVRTPHVLSYRLGAVDRAGNERPLPFRALPAGYRGLSLDLDDAASASDADRAGLCRAIVEGARAARPGVSFVRVYAVERDLSRRIGRTSAATSRLSFTCGRGSDAHGNG